MMGKTEASVVYLGSALVQPDILAKYPVENKNISQHYQKLHRAMLEDFYEHGSCDIVTVARRCKGQDWFSATELAELADHAFPPMAARHAEQIRKEGLERRIADIISTGQAKCDGEGAMEASKWMVEEFMSEMSEGGSKVLDLKEVTAAWYDQYSKGIDATPRVHTGNYVIDEDYRLTRGGLHTVAARPSMGKTAFAIWLGVQIASNGGKVLFFSAEMPKEQIAERVYRINQAKFPSNSFFIDDTPSIDVDELYAKAFMYSKAKGIDCVIVDYLQLLSTSHKESREREVSFMSARLKKLSRVLNVPVVCVCQLNRAVEMTKDKRPLLSHLRESGSIEQDSDSVAFLFRPAYYYQQEGKPVPPGEEHKCEITLAKQRIWKTKRFICNVDMSVGDFTDWGEGKLERKVNSSWKPADWHKKYDETEEANI